MSSISSSWSYHYILGKWGELRKNEDSVYEHGFKCNQILNHNYKKHGPSLNHLNRYYKTYSLLKKICEKKKYSKTAEKFFVYSFFSVHDCFRDLSIDISIRKKASQLLVEMREDVDQFYEERSLHQKRTYFQKNFPENKLKMMLVQ